MRTSYSKVSVCLLVYAEISVGGVIGVAVQAGLLVTGDGTIQDWTGSKDSYFLTGAYVLVSGLIFGVWYRQEKMPTNAEAPGCGGVVVPRDQV